MSAASMMRLGNPTIEESDLHFRGGEDLEHELESLKQLTAISPSPCSQPVVAIDLDDVLSQTNQAVAEWHNVNFGTKMDISSFYYYYYWKNPFWGTPQETFDKIKQFYATDTIYNTKPVPGAREGIQSLRDMGFKLIIVTARPQDNAEESWEWVENHFPGHFHNVICTGQFKDACETGHEVVTKSQVCADLGAKLLIDDSAENAVQCITATPPTPVLLFGDYEWNKRVSGADDATDDMSFNRRFAIQGGREFWKEESVDVPKGAQLYRVKDWGEVIQWVKIARSEGRI